MTLLSEMGIMGGPHLSLQDEETLLIMRAKGGEEWRVVEKLLNHFRKLPSAGDKRSVRDRENCFVGDGHKGEDWSNDAER